MRLLVTPTFEKAAKKLHLVEKADLDTGKLTDNEIILLVREHFSLTPGGLIKMLDLKRPIYQQTAAYGHFGRELPDFTWEKTDKADLLRKSLYGV